MLAVARGRHEGGALPESPREFELQLLGLLCLADPLRADVPRRSRNAPRRGFGLS